MTVFLIILAVSIILLCALLLPRVHVKSEYSDKTANFSVDWLWVSFSMDIRTKIWKARVLFFNLPREKKIEEEDEPETYEYDEEDEEGD